MTFLDAFVGMVWLWFWGEAMEVCTYGTWSKWNCWNKCQHMLV